jgi:hypothetical protein
MIRLLILTIHRVLRQQWMRDTYTVHEYLTPGGDPYLMIDYNRSRKRLHWLKSFLKTLCTDDAKGLGVHMNFRPLRGNMLVYFHMQPTN